MQSETGVSEDGWKYYDVVSYILSQQFFRRPNSIIDRRAQKKIKVKGSGEIIDSLIAIIKEQSKLFDRGKEEEFIKNLAKRFNIRKKTLYDEYQERIENLADVQKPDKKFKMMVALSGIITHLHQKATDNTSKILREEFKKEYTTRKINSAIGLLNQVADMDLSLLNNLGILNVYAKIIKYDLSAKYFDSKKMKVLKKIKNNLKSL
jgi:hypothetical protein